MEDIAAAVFRHSCSREFPDSPNDHSEKFPGNGGLRSAIDAADVGVLVAQYVLLSNLASC
jgi:hypothetical protein